MGIQLGPGEFAIPLPMDARIRDDYETTISKELKNIRMFLSEFSSEVKDSEPDVS